MQVGGRLNRILLFPYPDELAKVKKLSLNSIAMKYQTRRRKSRCLTFGRVFPHQITNTFRRFAVKFGHADWLTKENMYISPSGNVTNASATTIFHNRHHSGLGFYYYSKMHTYCTLSLSLMSASTFPIFSFSHLWILHLFFWKWKSDSVMTPSPWAPQSFLIVLWITSTFLWPLRILIVWALMTWTTSSIISLSLDHCFSYSKIPRTPLMLSFHL